MNKQNRYLVKIKTDARNENIYFETDDLERARIVSGVKDMSPYHEMDIWYAFIEFYSNGVTITHRKS
jgi:hypothetical protein